MSTNSSNLRLVLIREAVEARNTERFPVAVSAMNEKELVEFIFRWDTNSDQAQEAYECLRQLTGTTKYPDLKDF